MFLNSFVLFVITRSEMSDKVSVTAEPTNLYSKYAKLTLPDGESSYEYYIHSIAHDTNFSVSQYNARFILPYSNEFG